MPKFVPTRSYALDRAPSILVPIGVGEGVPTAGIEVSTVAPPAGAPRLGRRVAALTLTSPDFSMIGFLPLAELEELIERLTRSRDDIARHLQEAR